VPDQSQIQKELPLVIRVSIPETDGLAPTQSPDLDIMESVWDYMKHLNPVRWTKSTELWQVHKDAWNNMACALKKTVLLWFIVQISINLLAQIQTCGCNKTLMISWMCEKNRQFNVCGLLRNQLFCALIGCNSRQFVSCQLLKCSYISKHLFSWWQGRVRFVFTHSHGWPKIDLLI